MSHSLLQIIWFWLIGILIAGYAILDGFDLGVGVLSPFVAKTDKERRLLLNAIGPFWDGNEVWLLTAGGALFAAFPHVYATVFSGFYLAMMLVLFALILRAVSFEFRSRIESPSWRRAWDWVFFVGSFLPALLTGVALGNIVRGVPLSAEMEFSGSFLTLLNPLALLVGLAGLAMFMTHGAIYLMVKTDGEVAERAERWANTGWIALAALAVLTTLVAVVDAPARFDVYLRSPFAWVIPLLVIATLAYTRVSLARGRTSAAFASSAATIAGLVGIVGVGSYPYMVPARNVVEHGLTIQSASSSQNTLTAMLVIALVGMPLVIAYTVYIHYVFRGKAVVVEDGY